MTFSSLLNELATILRYSEGPKDDYGNPSRAWAIHLDLVACRRAFGKGREVKIGAEVIIIYDTLFVGDIDVTTWDRVIVDSVTYDIVAMQDRQDYGTMHHKELYLQRVD